MTRTQIIADLYQSKDFTNCIGKMKPAQLQDELKAEVALILCEKPEDKICELFKSGMLKFYTVRIILNLIQSNTSPFYKKFRLDKKLVEINDILLYKGFTQDIFNAADSWSDSDKVKTGQLTKIWDSISSAICADTNSYDDSKDRAIAEIENLYWYDREILKLYAEHGTYRKVEEVTGIPFESIYKTVQKGCKEIRRRVA